jgi:hypothetical protein
MIDPERTRQEELKEIHKRYLKWHAQVLAYTRKQIPRPPVEELSRERARSN